MPITSAEAVLADTSLARSLLRNGGVICWHDYGKPDLGVSKVIQELNRKWGDHIIHVLGTSLCFEVRVGSPT